MKFAGELIRAGHAERDDDLLALVEAIIEPAVRRWSSIAASLLTKVRLVPFPISSVWGEYWKFTSSTVPGDGLAAAPGLVPLLQPAIASARRNPAGTIPAGALDSLRATT